ncbi:Glucosylceramidase [Dufourea novaeangliae]|uniref:Glucosylceramidase n=1 Tax=Dufourea novaeangliae TaxID=178035 RepID=A0A154P4F4_DUFNO|nr:Glucosylceramidase [Dufourea novaeangliae]
MSCRIMWKALLVIGLFTAAGQAKDCVPRSFGTDKIVCVCNATYCDETLDNDPKVPPEGHFYWYVSTKTGLRLSMTEGQFSENTRPPFATTVTLTVNSTKKYQTIFGFGGAFTDSAGIQISKLSKPTQDQLIRAYFHPKSGSGYTLGRVPIGGTDFSTRPYTYDDEENDVSLEHFSLAKDDYDYKIPYIRKALEFNPELKLVSAAWSPPTWMKTNDKINGFGFLKKEYYQLYANYILKFLDEYKKNGIDIWAISTGNEPINAYLPFDHLNTLGWTSGTVANWVAKFLGPSLAASEHNNTKILTLDDQRIFLPWFVKHVLSNEQAKKYIAGTAVHWYTDFISPAKVLDETHDAFPDKFILMTEACTGTQLDPPRVDKGSWPRGEKYFLSIIEVRHWTVGWIDWNIALDSTGGPNWIKNFVDSPIIVNAETDEFYKQPMYHALKHFSRFIDRGSSRIFITDDNNVKANAFITPSNEIVVVLYNK